MPSPLRRSLSYFASLSLASLCLAAWAIWGGFILSRVVTAQPGPADSLDAPVQYTAERFTVSDGLPQNSVHAMAQTPDRYLWIGTRDGLARFDGATFTTYTPTNTPALPSPHITALATGPDSTLWIGTAQGMARYRNGSFEAMTGVHPTWNRYIRSLAVTPSGTLWATPERALTRYRMGTVTTITSAEWPGLRPDLIRTLYVDTQGRPWALYTDQVQGRVADSVYTIPRSPTIRDESLRAIGDGPNGTIQIGTEEGTGLRIQPEVPSLRPEVNSYDGTAKAYLFGSDTEALTWVARQDVVLAYRNGSPVFRHGSDPSAAYPPSVLYRDHSGTVWMGTKGGGLLRLHRPLFTVYDTDDGLSYNVVLALAAGSTNTDNANTMWLGTNCGGLNRWQNGQITPYVDANLPADACLYAMKTRSDGSVWLGHHDVIRLDENTSTRIPLPYDTSSEPTRGDVVKALYEDPTDPDVLWVGTIYGLYKLRNGDVQTHYTTGDGLPANRVQYIHRSAHTGALWLSTRQGLARYHNGTFTAFTPETGFPSRSPRAIYEDAQGHLWIGTYGDGLIHYANGTFTTLTEADGLFDNVVSAIVPDGQGRLWMTGNRGIARVRLDDLHAVAQGTRPRVNAVGYGEAAGLLNPETSGGFQSAAQVDAQGRLWFPTLQGVAVVDPREADAATTPPAVHIQTVSYQREPLPLTGSANQLPMGQRSFDIRYTGINLSRPNAVRFQYRLQGIDDGWQRADTRRTAFYTNVPPGTYTFEVRAANEDGQWSAPATLTLTVPPRFYETNWFWTLLGVLGVAGLVGAYRMRLRRLRARKAELQRQVRAQTAALREEKQRTAEALGTVAEQKEAISALSAAKSEFFANVSHEFRTPLTVALGLLEEWVETEEGKAKGKAEGAETKGADAEDTEAEGAKADGAALSQQLRTDLEQVLLQNRRVLRLVNQLLDIARLESHTLTLHVQSVALRSFLQRIARAFKPLASRRTLTFNQHLPDAEGSGPDGSNGTVPADPEHLETVVVNLLSNAFKFTPPGGTITLRAEWQAQGVRIQVEDTGPGIPEEEHDAIFERFAQSSTAAASGGMATNGTGIGLALVKALTEAHGGSVSVESTVGEGTTFTVHWPRTRAALPDNVETVRDASSVEAPMPHVQPEVAVPAAVHHSTNNTTTNSTTDAASDDSGPDDAGTDATDMGDATRPTVLIVDDNADIRRYVRRHLASTYHVVEAEHGQAGLEQARTHTPDCIISDVMMPVMDGVAMLGALRDAPATDFIPVVLLTARAELDDKIGGLEAGADDYLTKPFRPRELQARVRTLLAQRMRLRERFQNESPALAPPPDDEAPILQEVRQVVQAHLADPDFTVDDLADALHVSRSTLYRKLRPVTDHSPGDLIWQVRLTEAHALLAQGEGTVSEVAYGVGFKGVSHFSSRFQERFGVAPSEVAV